MSTEPTDVLPILSESSRGFDPAIRGYDRAQVDHFLAALEDDVRAAVRERDAANARGADIAAQLASAQAQIESLRRQLRAATESVTPENVDERVRQMLDTARGDAARVRAEADAYAEAERSGASDSAARTRAAAHAEAEQIVSAATTRLAEADDTFRRRLAEAEQHRTDVEASLAAQLAQCTADEQRLTREAQAERDRLDSDSLAMRARAEEDFEITLRARRTAEATAIEAERAEAHANAAQLIAQAQQRAEELVAEATEEVRRLHEHRDETHAALRALHGRLGEALDQALAQTPPE